MNDISMENWAIQHIQNKHMKKRRQEIYVACEELDFSWSDKEVKEFECLWKKGHSLKNISLYFNRDIDEVAILLIDRARQGKVKQRERGIRGE